MTISLGLLLQTHRHAINRAEVYMNVPVPNNAKSLRAALLLKVEEMQAMLHERFSAFNVEHAKDPYASLRAAGYRVVDDPNEDRPTMWDSSGQVIPISEAINLMIEYETNAADKWMGYDVGEASHLIQKLFMVVDRVTKPEVIHNHNEGLVTLPEFIDLAL